MRSSLAAVVVVLLAALPEPAHATDPRIEAGLARTRGRARLATIGVRGVIGLAPPVWVAGGALSVVNALSGRDQLNPAAGFELTERVSQQLVTHATSPGMAVVAVTTGALIASPYMRARLQVGRERRAAIRASRPK